MLLLLPSHGYYCSLLLPPLLPSRGSVFYSFFPHTQILELRQEKWEILLSSPPLTNTPPKSPPLRRRIEGANVAQILCKCTLLECPLNVRKWKRVHSEHHTTNHVENSYISPSSLPGITQDNSNHFLPVSNLNRYDYVLCCIVTVVSNLLLLQYNFKFLYLPHLQHVGRVP